MKKCLSREISHPKYVRWVCRPVCEYGKGINFVKSYPVGVLRFGDILYRVRNEQMPMLKYDLVMPTSFQLLLMAIRTSLQGHIMWSADGERARFRILESICTKAINAFVDKKVPGKTPRCPCRRRMYQGRAYDTNNQAVDVVVDSRLRRIRVNRPDDAPSIMI